MVNAEALLHFFGKFNTILQTSRTCPICRGVRGYIMKLLIDKAPASAIYGFLFNNLNLSYSCIMEKVKGVTSKI